jgi:hypothetical protein
MQFRLRTLLIVFVVALIVVVLNSATACAIVRVELPLPHDNESVRQEALKGDVRESAALLWLIESLAVSDRTKPVKPALRFPHSFEGQSREQIEKQLGKSIDWKENDYARPAEGGGVLLPNGEPAAGLEAKATFYAYKDVGGICVFYSEDGFALRPCAVYLRTDAAFVPLRRSEDIPNRLAWERPKLEQLRLWLGVPETVAKNSKGEVEISPKP